MRLARRPEPFDHPDWIYEIKFDGFRALAYIEDGVCRLVSRRRHEYQSFRQLNGSIAQLGVVNAVIENTFLNQNSNGVAVGANQQVVVTQPSPGTFKAFSAVCTHAGCTVGSVAGGTINCPCHGSKFNITDGSVANGPAKQPLPAKQVSVEGGTLQIN